MNSNMTPWTNPSNYKRTHKKKYTISASMPPSGTRVVNFLENANYVTNSEKQFVLTGTVGEQWVIDVNKLCRTYTFEDGTPINKDTLSRKVIAGYKDGMKYPCIKPFNVTAMPGVTNWAIHIPARITFPVQTSWGDTLICNDPRIKHGSGDYIVCSDMNGHPNLSDVWVVNGLIFPDTYDMRAFPNEATGQTQVKRNIRHTEFNGVQFSSGDGSISKSNNSKPVNKLLIDFINKYGDSIKNKLRAARASHLMCCAYLTGNESRPQYVVSVLNNITDNEMLTASIRLDPNNGKGFILEISPRNYSSTIQHLEGTEKSLAMAINTIIDRVKIVR